MSDFILSRPDRKVIDRAMQAVREKRSLRADEADELLRVIGRLVTRIAAVEDLQTELGTELERLRAQVRR